MYLVINKCVTAVKVSKFSEHYLRNRSNLDIGVLGYIGIVWPKEHSSEVWHIPPGTPCINIGANKSSEKWTERTLPLFFTDKRRLTTGIRSEKCVVRRFPRCANVIECTYTNLDSTRLFVSPFGISELDCATTKTDTAERSISIGRESLQVSFLY